MGRLFIGLKLTHSAGAWSDERWRLTQAAISSPAPAGEWVVRLLGKPAGSKQWLLLCSLSRERPQTAIDVRVDPGTAIVCEVVGGGGDGVGVDVVGFRSPGGPRAPGSGDFGEEGEDEDCMESEGEGQSEFARRATELNAERKRRRESLGGTPGPKRTPRLTFSPSVSGGACARASCA